MGKITKQWVQAALELADQGQAKLTQRERELFGLSSTRLRCLINNVCAPDNTRYLEIGVYRGSTVVAAAYGNKTTKVVGVDNYKYDDREPLKWTPEGYIWDNMKSQLEANLQRYKVGDNGVNLNNVTIIENKFEDVDWAKQEKFDVCFFDVSPVNTALYDEFFEKATLQIPAAQAKNIIQLEPDIIAWFKTQNKDYQTAINQLLRRHIESSSNQKSA